MVVTIAIENASSILLATHGYLTKCVSIIENAAVILSERNIGAFALKEIIKDFYRTDAMIGLLFDKLKYYKVTLSAAILINMIKECAVFLESVDRKQNEINDNAQRIKGSTETSFQEEYQQIIALFTEIYAQCEASFITLSADMNLLAISDIKEQLKNWQDALNDIRTKLEDERQQKKSNKLTLRFK